MQKYQKTNTKKYKRTNRICQNTNVTKYKYIKNGTKYNGTNATIPKYKHEKITKDKIQIAKIHV